MICPIISTNEDQTSCLSTCKFYDKYADNEPCKIAQFLDKYNSIDDIAETLYDIREFIQNNDD